MEVHLPVGYTCGVAKSLRTKGIRQYAYPFDWNISNRGTMLDLIKNKGEGFLLDENIIVGSIAYTSTYENVKNKTFTGKKLLDKKTGMLIVHDYPAEGIPFSEVRAKYKNRFERLDEHLKVCTKLHLYGRKENGIINLHEYNLLTERVGFDFRKHLPKDVSVNDIKFQIQTQYNIENIEVKYL